MSAGRDDGPSPRLRQALIVLSVVFTAVLIVFYAQRWFDWERAACVSDRPPGTSAESVETGWQWWPPGVACTYAPGAGTTV
ncbi:hypothetical protein [Paraoerskovia sediminicola]|nr:hypothetical protein [Paraoerskovia sediminicola]